jgi:hypothetical protein
MRIVFQFQGEDKYLIHIPLFFSVFFDGPISMGSYFHNKKKPELSPRPTNSIKKILSCRLLRNHFDQRVSELWHVDAVLDPLDAYGNIVNEPFFVIESFDRLMQRFPVFFSDRSAFLHEVAKGRSTIRLVRLNAHFDGFGTGHHGRLVFAERESGHEQKSNG